ncbi:MAG: hypothetical protein VCD00_11440 [Candidatus Hydrogenedentota bacterium]
MVLKRLFILVIIVSSVDVWGEDGLAYSGGEALGVPPAELVPEISGLAVSRDYADVVWVHNDSGDGAVVYALSLTTGELLGTATLPGVRARDWEDMAIGPGPDKRFEYLYLGDMGNNSRNQKEFLVYRTPEPVVVKRAGFAPSEALAKYVEMFRLAYPEPDRAVFDAEALLVDPESGELTVVTKDHDENGGRSFIFRTDGEPKEGELNRLILVGEIFFGTGVRNRVSGGDVSADGRWVVVRSYLQARVYRREEGQSVGEALLGSYTTVALAFEFQGEAIGFDRRKEFDGAEVPTFYSASELGPKAVNPNRVMRPISRYSAKRGN